MIEELERRAQGPGGAFPVQFIKATQALSLACARAAVETGGQLDPDVESALAQLDKVPPPLSGGQEVLL